MEYKCWRCGKEHRFKREPKRRIFCYSCLESNKNDIKEKARELSRLKAEIIFEKALQIMENTSGTICMDDFRESAAVIHQLMINKEMTYLSSYEVLVAIILYEYDIEFKANYKILKYLVDFYIPEFKVCLEVDGHLHRHKEEYDANRDIEIRNNLGGDWEVVRIPTKYLDMNPVGIIYAIEEMRKYQQDIRTKNNGILPDWFSMREKKNYERILGYKKISVRK